MTIEEEIQKNINNNNTSNSIVRMIGDESILISIIKLLAYIRHAIKNNLKCQISINIGSNIANGKFIFDVNQQEVKDLITKNQIEIN